MVQGRQPDLIQKTRGRRQALVRLAAAGATVLVRPAWASAQVSDWPAGQVVPPLQATDLNGKVWRLAELHGRAVLLNFWATWCEPCRAEMPALQQLAERWGPQRLLVLAINFMESADKAAKFVNTTGLKLPVLLDANGTAASDWAVRVFPTTILIAADGTPRQRVRGALEWAGREGEKLVQPLLKR